MQLLVQVLICGEKDLIVPLCEDKGIPTLSETYPFQKVGYIFDISQTVSMDKNVNEVELWCFDREKHENVLKDMIELQGYDSSESLLENLYSLSRIYADESIYELANNLRIADEARNSFLNFMRNSISFAISNRFNLDYPIPMDNLQENFKYLDRISLMSVGNCISNACSNIIEATMVRTRNLSVNQDLTKSIGADYNKLNENNNELGGMENAVRSNDQRDDDTRNRVLGNGEYGRDNFKNQGEDLEQSGKREEFHGGISKSDLRSDETGLSYRNERGETLSDANRPYKEKKLLMHLMEVQRRAIHFMREEKPKMMEAWKITDENHPEYKAMISALKEMVIKEIVEA